jgi:hypothetical protein
MIARMWHGSGPAAQSAEYLHRMGAGLIRDTGETYTSNRLGWMSAAAARSGTTSHVCNALDPLIE